MLPSLSFVSTKPDRGREAGVYCWEDSGTGSAASASASGASSSSASAWGSSASSPLISRPFCTASSIVPTM